MKYYKRIDGDYIMMVGTGIGGTEITESEYNEILTTIRNKPLHPDGKDYILKDDLTLEEIVVEPVADTDISDDEALQIIMGGAE